jgi:2-keto-4-pentenoate hydratase/2-oxohepta-3-ene-1,7-dioic acid hydratase in catechol pathway
MRLVHFSKAGRTGQGVLQGEEVRVLPAADGSGAFDLPARDPAEIARLLATPAPRLPLQGLTLLPPLAPHSQLICVGINYADHSTETGHAAQRVPAVFLRHPRGVVGHGQALCAPRASPQFDYEGELAIVIGRGGRPRRQACRWR